MHSILNRVHAAARRLRPLRCSFCGRRAREVERLVAGPAVHICDACIIKCVDILQQHGGLKRPIGGPAPGP